MTGAELTDRRRAVFVSDFVDINLPFEELAALVLTRSGACIARCPDNAGDPQAVRMIAGPPRVHDESVIVPITWQPGDAVRRLSTIEADLRLTSLGGQRSRAALSGSYRVALPCSAVEFDLGAPSRRVLVAQLPGAPRSNVGRAAVDSDGARGRPRRAALRTNGARGSRAAAGSFGRTGRDFRPSLAQASTQIMKTGSAGAGPLRKELSCRILLHCSEARRSAPAQRW